MPSSNFRSLKWLYILTVNVAVFVCLMFAVNVSSGLVLKYNLHKSIKAFLDQSDTEGDVIAPAASTSDIVSRTVAAESRKLKAEYRPFVVWSRLPFNGDTITINQHGDRIHKNSIAEGDDAPSIGVYGGSTVWGSGVADNETVPAHLNALLPQYRVFNFGEEGFNSRQNIARLVNNYSLGNRQDVVVFYGGVNDVHSLCRNEVSLPGHSREALLRGSALGIQYMTALRYVFLEYTIRLVGEISPTQVTPTSHYKCTKNRAIAERVAAHFVNNLVMANSIVTGYGGQFIGILQPVASIGSPYLGHLKNSKDYAKITGEATDQFRAVYPLIKEKIWNIIYINDFTKVFDSGDPVYIDGVHVNSRGNLIVATEIRRSLTLVRR